MVPQTNEKVEVNVEVNFIVTSDDGTITKEQYSPPTPPPKVFKLKKDKVKQLQDFFMSKGNPTSGKRDEPLENVREVIGDVETFTVVYSSEIVDMTVVTYKVNQIQNYVPPISWVVITGEDQGIVE